MHNTDAMHTVQSITLLEILYVFVKYKREKVLFLLYNNNNNKIHKETQNTYISRIVLFIVNFVTKLQNAKCNYVRTQTWNQNKSDVMDMYIKLKHKNDRQLNGGS